MNKLLKLSLPIIALVLLFAATSLVYAQEATTSDVALDETVTPSDLNVTVPQSGLASLFHNFTNGLQTLLTFNPVAKAELQLKQANEALATAQQALQNNPDDVKSKAKYEAYMEKFQNKMEKLQQKIDTFKDKAETNPKIDQFLNQLTDNSLKQQRLMDHLSGLLTDEQRANLLDKRETAIKTLGEALKNLDDSGNLPTRLDNIINQQTGSPLIHLKNLEVLQNLKEKLPEEALQGLQNAEENAVKRLNAAIQNMNVSDRQEKIQAYITNSNSDPIATMETLQKLAEDPTTLQEIKAAIPGIQSMKVEQIDSMINAFKNDEHKVRNLERIRQIEDPQTKTLLRQIEQKYNNPDAPVNSVNTPRDAAKNAIQQGIKNNTKPVKMQEKVEGGVDKVKDVKQNAINNQQKENQLRKENQANQPIETAQ